MAYLSAANYLYHRMLLAASKIQTPSLKWPGVLLPASGPLRTPAQCGNPGSALGFRTGGESGLWGCASAERDDSAGPDCCNQIQGEGMRARHRLRVGTDGTCFREDGARGSLGHERGHHPCCGGPSPGQRTRCSPGDRRPCSIAAATDLKSFFRLLTIQPALTGAFWPVNGPAALARFLLEIGVGVDRHRIAGNPQHLQVPARIAEGGIRRAANYFKYYFRFSDTGWDAHQTASDGAVLDLYCRREYLVPGNAEVLHGLAE